MKYFSLRQKNKNLINISINALFLSVSSVCVWDGLRASTTTPSSTSSTVSTPTSASAAPGIDVIVSERYSFLNFAKEIDLVPDTNNPGPTRFVINASVFSDGSLYIAGNTAALTQVSLPVIITTTSSGYVITDTNNQPIRDIFLTNGNGGTLQLTAENKPQFFSIADVLKHNFSFLKTPCTALKFGPSKLSKDKDKNHQLQTTCQIRKHFSHISVLEIKVNEGSFSNMTNLEGQAFSDINNLNGHVQMIYGVNGVALNTLQANASGNLNNVTVNTAALPLGSMISQKLATQYAAAGPNGPNPLTNTPNLFILIRQKYSFMHQCSTIRLDYVSGEGLYTLTAQCPVTPGAAPSSVQLNINIVGQNGRYRISDQQDAQISDIVYTNGKLQPVYAQAPDILTLAGRKFSVFNPMQCVHEKHGLVPRNQANTYTLKGMCVNEKKMMQESSVTLQIQGTNGQFQVLDEKGTIVSDIINDKGEIKVAPLSTVLTANSVNTFMQGCTNITLVPKAPASTTSANTSTTSTTPAPLQTSLYTLTASCNGPNGAPVQTSLDMHIQEKNGVFTITDANHVPCSHVITNNGQLACSAH